MRINFLIFAMLHMSVLFAIECSRDEAMKIETMASTLHDWNAVYNTYVQYGHCDDGAISEGFSESIARLLAEKWNSFSVLNKLVQRNPKFKVFVVKHIDDTVPNEYLTKILFHTKHECPPNMQILCNAINSAAE